MTIGREAGDFRGSALPVAGGAYPGPFDDLGLTEREKEVLMWVAAGKATADAATIIGIATRTVEKHLEHIYRKLGVENRTTAANIARDRMGLIRHD